ncbi:MAG: T9SS type A sorting domain-containing protein, partial [Calditrichia bacterium]
TNPDGQYDRLILGFRVYGTTAIDDPGQSEIAGGFSLQQNYPNPFNPTTRIDFTIPITGLVQLKVFNLVGQEVATIISEVFPAGSHSVQFSGENLNSSVYFYQLKAGKQIEMKKFILMK